MNRRPISDAFVKMQAKLNERKATSSSTVNEGLSIRFESIADKAHYALFRYVVQLVIIPTMVFSYIMYYISGAPESFKLSVDMS